VSAATSPESVHDHWAIATLQNAYGLAIDRRDWESFRKLFTPDVEAIYPAGHYTSLDEWVDAFAQVHLRYTTTHHSMTNHVALTRSDRAEAICYGVITLAYADGSGVVDSRTLYEDALIRADGEWRITKRRCHRQFWRVRPREEGDVVGPQLPPGMTVVTVAPPPPPP
jgi:hypothetical protein